MIKLWFLVGLFIKNCKPKVETHVEVSLDVVLHKAKFFTSAPDIRHLKNDTGIEVPFAAALMR